MWLGRSLLAEMRASEDELGDATDLLRWNGALFGGKILSSFEVRFVGNPRRRHYLLSAGPLHDSRERVA